MAKGTSKSIGILPSQVHLCQVVALARWRNATRQEKSMFTRLHSDVYYYYHTVIIIIDVNYVYSSVCLTLLRLFASSLRGKLNTSASLYMMSWSNCWTSCLDSQFWCEPPPINMFHRSLAAGKSFTYKQWYSNVRGRFITQQYSFTVIETTANVIVLVGLYANRIPSLCTRLRISNTDRQGTSYKYLMTGGIKGPLVVSYVIFPVESNELRGPFLSCIFNEIISIISTFLRYIRLLKKCHLFYSPVY